jgi:hypothetical protein
MSQVIESEVRRGNEDDLEYDQYLEKLQKRFLLNVDNGKTPVFTTDAEGLFPAYLDALPQDQRQYHTCHCCRTFVERFGGLVTIGEDGMLSPVMWSDEDAPDLYKPSVAAMSKLIRRGKVTGVFLASETMWGQHETGHWHHLAVIPPISMQYKRATLTAGQAMAEKREDFKTVMHALNEFTQPHLEQALTLLKSEAMYRSEKVLGQAEWLYNLHVSRAATHGTGRANVVWRAIGTAPAGFCHPRSSMIGTLLEDIAAGLEFSEVSRKFAAKMHPLQYQRPQAAPSAGAIAAAEKVMEQLGAAGSLARRFCRLDEVRALWRPVEPKAVPAGGGVFSHLAPKGAAPSNMQVPAQTMTWEKFQRNVLPTAEQIEVFAPHGRSAFAVLVTAVNADAPPILQWDSLENRNPVSWYVWHGGSTPSEFGLTVGAFHKVAALTLKPSSWGPGDFSHQGDGLMLVIDGAKESRQAGAAIFPECLKSEFHGIRSVIEAYSRGAKIEGMESPHAAGLILSKGQPWSALLRVTAGGKAADYKLDRWD